MPEDKGEEKTLLDKIKHAQKEKGNSNVGKHNIESSNYGSNHDDVGPILPSEFVNDESCFSFWRVSERHPRAASFSTILPYDMNECYKTIDDLRGAFNYSRPSSSWGGGYW